MHVFKIKILLILYIGILLPLFLFLAKEVTSQWCSALHHHLFLLGEVMAGHHCQILKSLLSSPPQPSLAPIEDGLALASL